jgi:hypothetical protein
LSYLNGSQQGREGFPQPNWVGQETTLEDRAAEQFQFLLSDKLPG